MAKTKDEPQTPDPTGLSNGAIQALADAINAGKDPVKKTAVNRIPKTPWTPKDGSPKIKLLKKIYQHGIPVDPDFCTNNQIELMNKLKTGVFLGGLVSVVRRRDKGYSIEYQFKTASQRLKLVNQYGIRDFTDLISHCVEEANKPKNKSEDEDDEA